MSDHSQQPKLSSKLTPDDINTLSTLFPRIASVSLKIPTGDLHELAIYLKYSNPEKHPKKIKELKSIVEQAYSSEISKLEEERIEEERDMGVDTDMDMETIDLPSDQCTQVRKERERSKFTLAQIIQFIARSRDTHGVDPSVVQQVSTVNCWQKRQSTCVFFQMASRSQPQQPIALSSTNSLQSQSSTASTITINIGANISPQARQMRLRIARQAQNNKMLTEEVSQIQQKERQVNYLLNRVTQQWYSDIEKEVKTYVLSGLAEMVAKKIVSKAIQEHSFIDIYCRMVEGYCKISTKHFESNPIDFDKIKSNQFKRSLISFLEQRFYELTLQNYEDEHIRKELLGLSLMMGRLFQCKILKKRIFASSFQWLINRYVKEHRIIKQSGFDHEIYIEMIIRMAQKMPTVFPSFTCQRSMIELSAQLDLFLLPSTNQAPPTNSYIPLLKLLIDRYPSPRRKLGFLLQDHELTKQINKGKQDHSEGEKKEIQRIFIRVQEDEDRNELETDVSSLIKEFNPRRLMHWYLMLLPQGTITCITKRISLFTLPSFKAIYHCFHVVFQTLLPHFVGLDCDYPYLATALAKLLIEVGGKIEITAEGEEADEQRQFIDKIHQKMKQEVRQIQRED